MIRKDIVKGLVWLEFPDSDFIMLCGCPSEAMKYLIREKLIRQEVDEEGEVYIKGPVCILLNDEILCGKQPLNLSEFPFFHMMFVQRFFSGKGHPQQMKPLILGTEECIRSQKAYLQLGLYGITDRSVLEQSGVEKSFIRELLTQKIFFAGGSFKPMEEYADFVELRKSSVEVYPGIEVKRNEKNIFKILYQGEETIVDLNFSEDKKFVPIFQHEKIILPEANFVVIDTGCGDGWNFSLPQFSSLIRFKDSFYQIDAGFAMASYLEIFNLSPNELDGLFISHVHDDHFANLSQFICKKRLKIFSTLLVHQSCKAKFAALTQNRLGSYEEVFELIVLEYDQWHNLNGLEVLCLHTAHPIENVAFHFRSKDKSGEYKSYSHYGDLTSFEILEQLQEKGNSPEFIQKIKQNYCRFSNLKKIDIGGGLIHGNAEDFINDTSDELILGHFSEPINLKQSAVGKVQSFGQSNILIP